MYSLISHTIFLWFLSHLFLFFPYHCFFLFLLLLLSLIFQLPFSLILSRSLSCTPYSSSPSLLPSLSLSPFLIPLSITPSCSISHYLFLVRSSSHSHTHSLTLSPNFSILTSFFPLWKLCVCRILSFSSKITVTAEKTPDETCSSHSRLLRHLEHCITIATSYDVSITKVSF